MIRKSPAGMGRTCTEQEELSNCHFVKTVLMVLVVCYHSLVFWKGNWFTANPVFEAPALGRIADWMNCFLMQGFVLTSGYVYFYAKHEKGSYQNFGQFLINKGKRLLIPYSFVAAVWVVPIRSLFIPFDGSTVFSSYVLAESPSQLWFLVMLFDVFLIFDLLSAFFRKHEFLGACCAIGLYAIGNEAIQFLPNTFQFWSALRFVPVFWMGYKIRQHGMAGLLKIPVPVWAILQLGLYILTTELPRKCSWFSGSVYSMTEFTLYAVGGIMAFLVLQNLACGIRWKESKWLQLLTKHSMTVYLLHQQLIYLLIAIHNGRVHPYLHVVINFAGALGIALLMSKILLKFKPTRFLLGEK